MAPPRPRRVHVHVLKRHIDARAVCEAPNDAGATAAKSANNIDCKVAKDNVADFCAGCGITLARGLIIGLDEDALRACGEDRVVDVRDVADEAAIVDTRLDVT